MPIRMGERDRIIRALDVIATTEWTRVLTRLPPEQVDSLRRAGPSYTPYELTHVTAVAREAARVYGHEHTGISHLAVALALTSGLGGAAVQEIAAAFGLGTLEDPGEILNQHLLRLEGEIQDEEDGDELPGIYRISRGKRIFRIGTRVHLLLRFGAAGVLLATTGGPAWLLAPLALLSSRDSREPRPYLVDPVGPWQLRTRWPLPGCWLVLACLLGEPAAAATFLVLLVALQAVGAGTEALVARRHRFFGERPDSIPLEIACLASVPETFSTRRAWRRLVVAVVAAVPVAVLAAQVTDLWPLYALPVLLIAGRSSGFAVVPLAVAALLGGPLWPVPAAAAAGTLARVLIIMTERPPASPVPVPRIPGGAGGLRALERRVRRTLRAGRPVTAVRLLAEAPAPLPPVLAGLHGWALLGAAQPGDAKAAVRGLRGELAPVKALVTGLAELELENLAAARSALEAAPAPRGRSGAWRVLHDQQVLAHGRLLCREAPALKLAAAIARRMPATVRGPDVPGVATMLRLVAEAQRPSDPKLAWYLAAAAYVLIEKAEDGRIREFSLIDPVRDLNLESLRAIALIQVVEMDTRAPSFGDIVPHSELDTSRLLLRANRPMEAAAFLNELADHHEATGERLSALDHRIEALAVLHWNRHRVRDLEERRLWWRAVSDTMDRAMVQAAAGQDWDTLAELIESARLQLGPGEHEDAAGAADTPAPFIRMRGVSRLEAASWYRPGERPPVHDLEDLAAAALGAGTWWWSTWSTADRVFWALVPPDGPVTGGVLDRGPGTGLGGALARLHDALPLPHSGETGAQRAARVLDGPLCGPPHAELDLARSLGRLLPPRLREELAGPDDLRLAIAPAQALAGVPWPLVALPDDDRDLRLVERCRLAIAPPAALLAAIARRERRTDTAPVALAVLDPGGAFAAPDARLDQAASLAGLMPSGATVVSQKSAVDVDGFARLLEEVPAESSAVFACHTHPGNGTPLSGGLLLCPPIEGRGTPEILTAGRLIDGPAVRIPRQVLLLACESADLRQAAEGEWLVLGPAMLWAGADRLIVTGYPTPDEGGIDRVLTRHLLAGHDLVDALRTVQTGRLGRWRESGGESGLPLHWAGHMAMGAFGDTGRLVARPAGRAEVDRDLVRDLDEAATGAAAAGRPSVTAWDVLLELAAYGFEDALPLVRRLVVRTLTVLCFLARLLRRVPRRPWRRAAPGGTVDVGSDVLDLLSAAAGTAADARHRVICIEHLLVAALASRGAAAAVARAVTGWDGRQPEVVRELIDESQSPYLRTGRPETSALSPAAVTRVYGALGVREPEPERQDA
ncbi:CHAT domain-containing protein [Actinomadura madurae]|uniref:CHAT domain-containing protein n=1 Tax=Actinomadura madurae TaxID=1993 RepID=UPI003999F2E3